MIKNKKKPIQYERNIQISLFNWAKNISIKEGGKLFDYMISTPNGGSRNYLEAINLKKSGLSAGFPDVSIFLPRGNYHAMFLEIKKDKKSRISDNQNLWIMKLNKLGYFAEIGCGIDECIDLIRSYINK